MSVEDLPKRLDNLVKTIQRDVEDCSEKIKKLIDSEPRECLRKGCLEMAATMQSSIALRYHQSVLSSMPIISNGLIVTVRPYVCAKLTVVNSILNNQIIDNGRMTFTADLHKIIFFLQSIGENVYALMPQFITVPGNFSVSLLDVDDINIFGTYRVCIFEW